LSNVANVVNVADVAAVWQVPDCGNSSRQMLLRYAHNFIASRGV